MKRIIAVSFVAMAISAFGGTFETEDAFSITLPDGWVKIPTSVIANFSDRLGDDTTSETVHAYDYGFQMDESAGWLSYPCILVQVKNLGRFSTGSLERFVESNTGNEANLADDKTLFMEVREQDGVKVLFGRQLTEYGFIELTGFAPADKFDDYEGVFKAAFSTLGIDDAISYKPRLTDNAPVIGNINLGKVLVVCVQAALIGGLLWFVYRLLKRKLRHA